VPISLDGWHFPNSYLETHTTIRDGISIPLRSLKGGPETFDQASALHFLYQAAAGSTLPYPSYSRVEHEPVYTGLSLNPQHRLVLFEGNYLLLAHSGWEQFQALFQTTIFLTAPRADLIASLRARHIRGGRSPDSTDAHMAFSDIPNLDLIFTHSKPADILVVKSDILRIQQVIYPHT